MLLEKGAELMPPRGDSGLSADSQCSETLLLLLLSPALGGLFREDLLLSHPSPE